MLFLIEELPVERLGFCFCWIEFFCPFWSYTPEIFHIASEWWCSRRSLFPFWKAFKERKILKFRVCVSSSTLKPLFGQPGLHNKAPGGKSTRLSCSCRGTFGSYFATWKNEFTWSWQLFFFSSRYFMFYAGFLGRWFTLTNMFEMGGSTPN